MSRVRGIRDMQVAGVRFLGQQDGAAERLLKGQLIQLLGNIDEVRRAYLAQIEVGKHASVGLCLRTTGGPDAHILREIGKVFAEVFEASEHLDILFLDDTQETELAKICAPFYDASGCGLDKAGDTGGVAGS